MACALSPSATAKTAEEPFQRSLFRQKLKELEDYSRLESRYRLISA
jgi:hypothetical protein